MTASKYTTFGIGLTIVAAIFVTACSSETGGEPPASGSEDAIVAAPAVLVCGGIAGLSCPDGYECRMGGVAYPDQAGTCIRLSTAGEPCGDDVAVQKHCAAGLSCVWPAGGPISEHTPGVCVAATDAGSCPPPPLAAPCAGVGHGTYDAQGCLVGFVCETPTDACGGCAPGKYCAFCFGHDACIPNGAFC